MPIRFSKNWRRTLSKVTRLQLEDRYPEWNFFWESYSRNQRKAVRRLRRDSLKKMQHGSAFEPLNIAQHMVIKTAAPFCIEALLSSVLRLTSDGNDDLAKDCARDNINDEVSTTRVRPTAGLGLKTSGDGA
jgi:hypothetical protein